MATAVLKQVVSTSSVPTSSEQILSDDQIEQLLQQAEVRMRAKAAPVPVDNDDLLVLAGDNERQHKHVSLPKLQSNAAQQSQLLKQDGVVKPPQTVSSVEAKQSDGLRRVATQHDLKAQRLNDQSTAGPKWFDMPKTELTSSLKRDLQLIEMRNVLDPHRHYKKNNRKGQVPTFSQTGTVIQGPTEWYSSRINNKDRSKTFVEEEMKNERETGRFKRKYSEIQDKKTSGKKAYYKKLMEKRKSRT